MIGKSEISDENDAFGVLLLSNARHAERLDDNSLGLDIRPSKKTTEIRPSRSPLVGLSLVLRVMSTDPSAPRSSARLFGGT